MKERSAILLCALATFLAGAVAIAQKNVTLSIKLSRLEGKAQELLLNATSILIDDGAIWTRSVDDPNSDAPAMEYSAAEPRTLTVEMGFDTFETKENVHDKFIAPIENLAAVDPQLQRPPMVQATFSTLPSFKGVLSNVSTKYTLFLPDGTPTRATCVVVMKTASSAKTKKTEPCP